MIHAFHDDILHSGVNKLFLQIRADFFWNSLYRDCEEYVKTCHNCQLAKNISIHTKVPTKSLDQASQPMESITIDHVGPLSHILQTNHRYILTIQCDFSRFLWPSQFKVKMERPLSTCFFNCSVNTGFQSTVIQIMAVHSLLTSQNRFFRLTQLLTSGHLFIIPKVKLVWNVHTRQLEQSSACIQTLFTTDLISSAQFALF